MGVEAEAVVVVAPTPNHEHGAQNVTTCLVCLGVFFFRFSSSRPGLVWLDLVLRGYENKTF